MNAKPQSVNEHRIENALPPVKTSEKYLKFTSNFVTFGIMPTLQRLSRGRSQKIHIGAFAFSDEKQRHLFNDIIVKEPNLVDNDALIGTVERIAQVKTSSIMHKHERLNGHKLNVKISEDPNSESSITFHDKKRRGVLFDRDASDEITLHLKPGAPAETEALLYIAEQTALRGNLQKLMFNDNFQSWVQGEDGSLELKNALLKVQVANDPEKPGKYRVSSKTQQQSVEQQGQSTDNNDQITSLPNVEAHQLQPPLRDRDKITFHHT